MEGKLYIHKSNKKEKAHYDIIDLSERTTGNLRLCVCNSRFVLRRKQGPDKSLSASFQQSCYIGTVVHPYP